MYNPTSRKRQVTSCNACYTRKQKCDRQYPCNHCTRRRRPEECIYSLAQPSSCTTPSVVLVMDDYAKSPRAEQPPLLQSFGYLEESELNTAALLRNLGSSDDANLSPSNVLAPHVAEKIQQDLQRHMPPRPILDFLIQYFVSDLNWMKQLIHPPTFLPRYQQWWNIQGLLTAADIEFAALIFRICSYAAQFLPSPTCTVDQIGGLSLSDIRDSCSTLGDDLAQTCASVDWKGSLIRVQHVLFRALDYSCQGRTDKFWEGIGCASKAAQKVGIHKNVAAGANGVELMNRELERRVFCSLYVLDSHVARQLDRVPFLPDNLVDGLTPQMYLAPSVINTGTGQDAPEPFTERLMQLDLNRFWRSCGMNRSSEYDPIQSEGRFERFCTEYLSKLPPAFALNSNTQWDSFLPKLAMQRQILHICIFDSICWNFRPLLLMSPSQKATLDPYKQSLFRSQKKTLAMAALRELDAISALHAMFNNAHTRFAIVIFNTFEAAVLLLCLCLESHQDIFMDEGPSSTYAVDLMAGTPCRERMLLAAEKAFERLQMLASVSGMAASGARAVEQLFANVRRVPELHYSDSIPSSHASSLTGPLSSWYGGDLDFSDWNSDPNVITELLLSIEEQDLHTDMAWSDVDFHLPELIGADS